MHHLPGAPFQFSPRLNCGVGIPVSSPLSWTEPWDPDCGLACSPTSSSVSCHSAWTSCPWFIAGLAWGCLRTLLPALSSAHCLQVLCDRVLIPEGTACPVGTLGSCLFPPGAAALLWLLPHDTIFHAFPGRDQGGEGQI